MKNFTTNLLLVLFLLCSLSVNSQTYGYCDFEANVKGNNSRFVLEGYSWNCRYVSYFFENGTSDISGSQEETAIKSAFATWSAIASIDFYEACNANEADIRISWQTGNHGDHEGSCVLPCPFDGLGGKIAHTSPLINVGAIRGDIHFDDAEVWTLNGVTPDLQTVALHEIGHAIGLSHEDTKGDIVMDSGYDDQERILMADDIAGARAIYGFRTKLISGPSLICNQSTKQFSLTDDCNISDYTITWSVTSDLQITGGQGTKDVSIKGNSTSSEGTITLTLDFGCDELVYTKDVCVGKPTSYPTLNPSGLPTLNLCLNEVRTVNITDTNCGESTGVTWNTSGSISDAGGWNGLTLVFTATSLGSGNYTAQTQNACGVSATAQGAVFVTDCGGGQQRQQQFIISPNPVTSNAIISVNTFNDKSESKGEDSKIYGIEVVDQYLRKQISKRYKIGFTSTNLDLSQLVSGIYTVSIFDGKKWYPYQVVKE